MQVDKIICKCGKQSYDKNDFEFCVYCGKPMCYDCVKYEFIDGLDEPVCEKCENERI